jgi:rubrerythrin
MKALYKCVKCGYEYESHPGPTQCPRCQNLYVKWVNYDEWRNKVMNPKYGDLY